MARGRMVNQTVATDKKLNELSLEAELLYLKTIPHLDRDGLILGEPMLLWAQVCPRRPELMAAVGDLIAEWLSAGLVIAYEDNDDTVLFFVGFTKNQSGMRYERESPSRFGVPPGYERMADGLQPIGKKGTANSGGSSQNGTPIDSGKTPARLRLNDGLSRPNRIEENINRIEEKENSACACEDVPTTTNGSLSHSDEYLPGIPDPRKRKPKTVQAPERVLEAKALGLDAEQFRLVVDALLDGFGKKPLVDAGDERALNYVQDLALLVMGMNERFRTPDGIQSIFQSWRDNDYRGDSLPTSEQFKEHASLMASGKVVCTRKDKPPEQTKQSLAFKPWLLRTYMADNPKLIDVPLPVLQEEYQNYVKQYH